ncbi:hypothetical protein DC522_30980 [Microvirga sp. KLBC 81]|uniref:hypothetical protein n=1 Tax=Microvirga sp. KLBC 81 TaxID=1862707 RepID=UPI000D512F0D|nr:hypothetical protein [Microvirga sp. KLBC 81]PVE20654.1 hypothetical protein DC522_30980 [Microvirga sp. KLBC 81]
MVAIVADDLAAHGPQVVTTLRERDPVAYARLVSDLVAFKPLLRLHAGPDKPVPAAGEPTKRERLGKQLLEVVAADFAQQGSDAVASLREKKPSAYARCRAIADRNTREALQELFVKATLGFERGITAG